MRLVQRVRTAWLIALPLTVLAWLAAHQAAYDLAFPGKHAREHALAASGHGYLELAPLVAAICLTATVAGFLFRLAGRGSRRGVPAWAFGALPLLGFAVQEHVERWLSSGELPLGTALAPVFLIGLALQLPFALVAAVLARALLSVADEVAAALAGPPAPRLRPARLLIPSGTVSPPAPSPLSANRAGRAPPAAA
jgi:hypothetical protein